jgi:hypothetical protein
MFGDYLQGLISTHRTRGVLLDTNLLLLLIVGKMSRGRIATFKRTSGFTASDFDALRAFVSRFDWLVTTPNIATEADNLSRQLPLREHDRVAATFAAILSVAWEDTGTSKDIVREPFLARFGLTDSLSIKLSEECLLLTDDGPLYHYASSTGRAAVDFQTVRESFQPPPRRL